MLNNLDLLVKGTDIGIALNKNCIYCGEKFIVTDLEIKILKKHKFKDPEHCPLCNFKILNGYLNDKNLYYIEDVNTGQSMISIYSNNLEGRVISVEDYDKLIQEEGGLKFGKEVSDDILKDFVQLYNSFPKQSRIVYPNLENGDYSSHTGRSKNIYLSYCVFNNCEDVFFSFRVTNSCKNVFSSFSIARCTNIYYSNNIGGSYNIYFGDNMYNCSDLLFCEYMMDSSECIFCCNQVNSKYKIFNKQYTKQEYLEIKKDIYNRINNKKDFKFLLKKYNNFLRNNLVKQLREIYGGEGVVGEKTYNSKNCVNTFSSAGLENGVNILNVGSKSNDNLVNLINSCDAGDNVENIIGSCSFGVNVYNIFFSFGIVENSSNIYYSYDIKSSEELMFCVGLKNKKFCILNKEYSEDEYFKLKKKIISDLISSNKWGSPLPVFFNDFPYNDTLAYDYFKINKVINVHGEESLIDKNANGVVKLLSEDFISDAVLDLGSGEEIKIKWRTKEKEINIPEGQEIIDSSELPNTQDSNNELLNKLIKCEKTGQIYKIVKKELDFLKTHNLPLPTHHHQQRVAELMDKRPTGKFNDRTCDNCNKEDLTVVNSNTDYTMYCEECYRDFMYS